MGLNRCRYIFIQARDSYMLSFFSLIRIHHWLKNLLVLFPAFFSGKFFCPQELFLSFRAFFSFSLLASAVYIFNDLYDMKKDQRHPVKCHRPLASGKVSKLSAILMFLFLIVLSVVLDLAYSSTRSSLVILLIYLILNLGYSISWKNIPLVDIVILASGFVLRLFYGGEFMQIPISHWLFLCIMTSAMFLGIGKRRNELRQFGEKRKTRLVLHFYKETFLDQHLHNFGVLALVFYSLWTLTISTTGIALVWSVPFCILLFFRYTYIIESSQSSGDPVNVIIKDWPLLTLIGCWGIFLLFALYGHFFYEYL